MKMSCPKCGYTGDVLEFEYLGKGGCPACGSIDVRKCPKCGSICLHDKGEALEREEEYMRELSLRLASLKPSNPEELEEAKNIIRELRAINLRWNIRELDEFLDYQERRLGLLKY